MENKVNHIYILGCLFFAKSKDAEQAFWSFSLARQSAEESGWRSCTKLKSYYLISYHPKQSKSSRSAFFATHPRNCIPLFGSLVLYPLRCISF